MSPVFFSLWDLAAYPYLFASHFQTKGIFYLSLAEFFVTSGVSLPN